MMLQVNGCHEDGSYSGEPAKLRTEFAGFQRAIAKASTKVLMHLGAPLRDPTQKGASRQRFEVMLNMACDSLTRTGVLAVRSKKSCAQVSVTKNGGLKKTAASRMAPVRAVETAAEWLLALNPINALFNAAMTEEA